MVVLTTKSFDKQYSKLNPKIKNQFKNRLLVFMEDQFDASLRNHALRGKYQGYRSIDVSGDVRALYTQRGDSIIIFALIGSHSQLYG